MTARLAPEARRAYDRGYREKNRDVINAGQRARYAAGYRKTNRRDIQLRTKYGITEAEYVAMLAAQEGRCAICGRLGGIGRRDRLHVDHDHATLRVRALLCGSCNSAVGMLGDDPVTIRAAAAYVERFAVRPA